MPHGRSKAWGGNLSDLQDEEALAKIPGIGKAIAAKVKELATTGSLKYMDELRAEFPAAILELFSIPGLGAKKIKALYEQLEVSSIEQLLKACQSGRVAQLAGFGETTQEKLYKAITERARHSGSFQLGQIAIEAEVLRSDYPLIPTPCRRSCRQLSTAQGDRARPRFIVATKEPERMTKFLVEHALVESVIAQGPTQNERAASFREFICDLRVVTPTEYPFALNYFTGSKEHNIEMRNRALKQGWTLNEYRLAPLPPEPKNGRGGSPEPPARKV